MSDFVSHFDGLLTIHTVSFLALVILTTTIDIHCVEMIRFNNAIQ